MKRMIEKIAKKEVIISAVLILVALSLGVISAKMFTCNSSQEEIVPSDSTSVIESDTIVVE